MFSVPKLNRTISTVLLQHEIFKFTLKTLQHKVTSFNYNLRVLCQLYRCFLLISVNVMNSYHIAM